MARTDDDEQQAARELQRSEADEPIRLSLAASASVAAAAPGDSKAAAAGRAAPKAAAPLFGDDEGGHSFCGMHVHILRGVLAVRSTSTGGDVRCALHSCKHLL